MGRIRGWWNSQNPTTRQILIVFVVVSLVFSVAGVMLSGGNIGGLLLNFGTEMGGAVVTFVLITQIVGGAEEQERLKRDLIMRMGSKVNDTARSAVDELRVRGWLRDGSLKGAELVEADLQGGHLVRADLQEAHLVAANLQRAHLPGADLQGADLWEANLQEANLRHAYLQGTIFWQANLQEANLSDVEFSEDTVVPNGTKWTPDTDLARFTDPNHPDFWRPEPGSVWWYPAEEVQHGDE